jgi:hypothetical protein
MTGRVFHNFNDKISKNTQTISVTPPGVKVRKSGITNIGIKIRDLYFSGVKIYITISVAVWVKSKAHLISFNPKKMKGTKNRKLNAKYVITSVIVPSIFRVVKCKGKLKRS